MMKKITLLLIAAGLSSQVLAALPTGIGEMEVSAPVFKNNYIFGVSALLLKASVPELDYALVYPSAITDGGGAYAHVRPGYHLGYQLEFGYFLPCSSNAIRLTYTNYFAKDTAYVIPSDNGLIVPLLTYSLDIPAITGTVQQTQPSIIPIGSFTLTPAVDLPIDSVVTRATATAEFKEDVLDLDFGQYINIDTFFQLHWFCGLRYARVKHKLDIAYDYASVEVMDANTIAITPTSPSTLPPFELTSSFTFAAGGIQQHIAESSHYNGLGPSIGVDGSLHTGGGFGLLGKVRGSLLLGEKNRTISQEFSGNSFTLTDMSFTNNPQVAAEVVADSTSLSVGAVLPIDLASFSLQRNDQLGTVPNIEAKLAINYSHQFINCNILSFELGYVVNLYFSAVNRLSSIIDPALYTSHKENLSFSGPYLTLSYSL